LPPASALDSTSNDDGLAPVIVKKPVTENQGKTSDKDKNGRKTANKPIPAINDQNQQPLSAALYANLTTIDPAVRTKLLTIALHNIPHHSENPGKSMSLTTCLNRSTSGNPRATIVAYWRLSQCAARYQLFVQQAEWLDNLAAAVFQRREQPTSTLDMLHVRAAQVVAKAAVHEAQANLVAAQFELASQTSAIMDIAWPITSTPPHSGKYLLKLDAQPRQVAMSPSIRHLAAKIPALGDSIQDYATAVVEADAARASAVSRFLAGDAAIDSVLEIIQSQTHQTAAILDTLREYNAAIADYAIAVLPPGIAANKLAATLVVKPD
jgi:hypothetical protein